MKVSVKRGKNPSKAREFLIFYSVLFSFLAILALPLFAGCRAPVKTNPAEILKQAYSAQKRLKSVKVHLRVEVKLFDSPNGKELMSRSVTGRGEYESPDRSRMVTKSGPNLTEVITIGDKSYVRTAKEGWIEKRATGSESVAATVRSISSLLRLTKALNLKGATKKDYHISFRVDLSKVKSGFSSGDEKTGLPRGATADIEVWVDKNSFLVNKLRIKQDGQASDLSKRFMKTVITFEFFDFDEPVSIEAPF